MLDTHADEITFELIPIVKYTLEKNDSMAYLLFCNILQTNLCSVICATKSLVLICIAMRDR